MSELQSGPIRELTVDERFTWGTCPICQAGHGQRCHPEIGIQLGTTVDGKRLTEGAHLGRIRLAPVHVREVPVNAVEYPKQEPRT